ncbi:hypothetical protein AB0M54_30080 [Actinoplanes sp. NPDC051470]|uniref:hypothetical protein n=1 Tax=Actinoplanes sp. NPDC051470 TaxID=3157224 RepID=UPI003440B731
MTSSPTPVQAPDYRIAYQANPDAASVREALGGDASHRTIAEILADANRTMEPLSAARRPAPDGLSPSAAHGFGWNSEDQADDRNFLWYPQGITTTADAAGTREYDGAEAVALSWYRRKTRNDHAAVQSRISLAPAGGHGAGRDRYRHVLLVQPDGKGNIQHVPCHAGGALWYGNLLYVASTSTIRVFDWHHLHEVKTSSLRDEGFGRQSDGRFYAAGYRYVLVEVGTIISTGTSVRFSSLALDRASEPDRMVVSAYVEQPAIALWRFDLDPVSHLPSPAPAVDAYHLPFTHVQGATTRNDRFWFSSSGPSPRLRYWHRTAGAEPVAYPGTGGAESLSYWSSGDDPGGVPDCLYTMTESPGTRQVFAIRQAGFDGDTPASGRS